MRKSMKIHREVDPWHHLYNGRWHITVCEVEHRPNSKAHRFYYVNDRNAKPHGTRADWYPHLEDAGFVSGEMYGVLQYGDDTNQRLFHVTNIVRLGANRGLAKQFSGLIYRLEESVNTAMAKKELSTTLDDLEFLACVQALVNKSKQNGADIQPLLPPPIEQALERHDIHLMTPDNFDVLRVWLNERSSETGEMKYSDQLNALNIVETYVF